MAISATDLGTSDTDMMATGAGLGAGEVDGMSPTASMILSSSDKGVGETGA